MTGEADNLGFMPIAGAREMFALERAMGPEPMPLAPRQRFIEALAEQTRRGVEPSDTATDRTGPARRKQLRDQIENLVSMALVLPMLKQVRSDPFKSEMFHGGFGEEVFGSQMDMVMAERLGPRVAGPIVDATYRRLAGPESSGVLNGDG